jgi:threonine dehydrogenase-like Zn-dependent dehydrogenase
MGVTDFVNSKACGKPVHEVIREMTDGGVDFSFECTGIVDVLRESFVSTHDVCISPYSVLHFLFLFEWAEALPFCPFYFIKKFITINF